MLKHYTAWRIIDVVTLITADSDTDFRVLVDLWWLAAVLLRSPCAFTVQINGTATFSKKHFQPVVLFQTIHLQIRRPGSWKADRNATIFSFAKTHWQLKFNYTTQPPPTPQKSTIVVHISQSMFILMSSNVHAVNTICRNLASENRQNFSFWPSENVSFGL